MKIHTAEKIDELIKFNEHTVEKKILAKNGDDMILLVALKENQELPEHISPVDAFIYVVYGDVNFNIKEEAETKTYAVKTGETFSFKKDEKHFVTAEKDSVFFVMRMPKE